MQTMKHKERGKKNQIAIDKIITYLKENERSVTWLQEKTNIPYGTLYSIFGQGLSGLSDLNKNKISKALKIKL